MTEDFLLHLVDCILGPESSELSDPESTEIDDEDPFPLLARRRLGFGSKVSLNSSLRTLEV